MGDNQVTWQKLEVTSPTLTKATSVIAALNVPYVRGGHRFQTVCLYIPDVQENASLIGQPATSLPTTASTTKLPRIHVHIHGGAWRDPNLTCRSIEPAVAHAFSDTRSRPIDVIASINYTLSPFPTHPTQPYDPIKDNHSDPAREAVHPEHLRDVIAAFGLLKQYGLKDKSYILTGHSAGACLSFQSTLKPPSYWNQTASAPPVPTAVAGLNGLYDLVELVSGLGPTHKNLREVYQQFQGITFGTDQSKWPSYSPARFDVDALSSRVAAGEAPTLILLDQSTEDQLVPINQRERLQLQLNLVDGLKVVQGKRCTGVHAAPWEQGHMIWETVKDVLALLQSA